MMNHNLPQIPPEVIYAIEEKRLILFLGAGVSCAAGGKNWDTISDEMLNIYRNQGLLEIGDFNRLQSEDYYTRFEFLKQKSPELFRDLLAKSLIVKEPNIIANFKILMKKLLKFKPVSIVTTNIDDLLQKSNIVDSDKIFYLDDCNPQYIHKNCVFCIHGAPKNNIFVLSQKMHYYRANNNLIFFLHNVFGSFCVLFIGYSLNPEDVLEGCYINTRSNDKFYYHALVPSDLKLRGIGEMGLEMKYKIKLHKYPNNETLNYRYFKETIDAWTSKL
jgi:hypothetical protein